ncbi:MAG: molybdenum cofactor guanylyltransferase [Nitrospirota bacterium]
MTAAILSGGENTRMPVLKGFLEVDGRTILSRSLELLKRVFRNVVINTNMPERYFSFGVPLKGDIRNERGPMTGILSLLAGTGDDSVFVVACDMPFINEELIRYMVDCYERQGARGEGQADAVIPVFRGKPEPLLGIYSRSAIMVLEEEVRKGKRGIQETLTKLNVLYITDEEVRRIDPEGLSFVNINTINDYERIGGNLCLG